MAYNPLRKHIAEISPQRWKLTDDPTSEAAQAYTALNQLPVVRDLISDFIGGKYKVYFVHSGRRSFKSELAKRLLVWYATTHRQSNLLYCGPTARQVSDIAWEDLKSMIPKMMIYKIENGNQILTLKNRTKIKLYSLDNPKRIEGQKIDGIVLDEFADVVDGTWENSVYPGISDDPKTWALVVSTPSGRGGDFYQIYERMMTKPEEHSAYKLYHWHRGQLLGNEWLEQFKETVDPRSYRQEWLGEFVSGKGQAYLFDRMQHISDATPFLPILPLDICCDFNVNIMPWLICQSTADTTFVLDEVVGRQVTVETMTKLLKQRLVEVVGSLHLAKAQPIRFYGDASASYVRDPASHIASWDIIRKSFRDDGWNATLKVSRQNPRIGDRLVVTNSRLITADGMIHTKVNPKARELIADFDGISYEDIMNGQKDRISGERSHASDAFAYYIYTYMKSISHDFGVRGIPIYG